MYITSRRSADKIMHEEHCRYAKMIAPHNKQRYYFAPEAYADGCCACVYCARVMRKIPSELSSLQQICADNGIIIAFDRADGTLNIIAKKSEWKVAPARNGKLSLYHKSTSDFVDNNSPYEGFHNQHVYYGTIMEFIEYIIHHDRFKKKQAKKEQIQNGYREHFSKRRKEQQRKRIVKMRKARRYGSAIEYKGYAAGY